MAIVMGPRLIAFGLGLLSPLLWGFSASALSAPVPNSTSTPTLGPAMKPSTAEKVALAEHLRKQGVLFYGAWWCPACFKQKDVFGQQAGDRLPYVECEKTDEQRERCTEARIEAYPTWVMGEQRLEGVQSPERLGQWSGFQK
jgi:hypothetical protein